MTAPALASLPSLGRSLSILYADDVPQLRNFMRLLLTRAGHRLEAVPDGVAALDLVGGSPDSFDLIITDHHMPRLTGLELVTNVRKLPYHGKIVVFSSSLLPTVAEDYRLLGVDLILPKPMFPSTLLLMMEQLFRVAHALPPRNVVTAEK